MRRILVIGGGIAGVEGALTLARGLPDDHVTLLTHADELRVMPDLVYIPTGVAAHRISVPLRELLVEEDIEVVLGEVECVDLAQRIARCDTGAVLPFDVVVAAPGAAPQQTSGMQVQTVEQAELVRDRLDELFAGATSEDQRASIIVRASADDAWAPPAYEFAALLAARRRMLGVEQLVSIALITAELQPFQWFEPHVADVVVDTCEELGIELATGVPEPRFDDLIGDLVVDFGHLEARHVPGLPGRDERGWYATDADGRVHPDAFVLGDATSHGYKSAFAVAWQARRVLSALGGSLESLGTHVGGVPIDAIEHHVDLGTRTLRIRLPVAARLHDPWLGHDATVEVDDAPPDRLAGLLVGMELQRAGGRSAAHAHRALVTRPVSPLPPGVQARLASSPSP